MAPRLQSIRYIRTDQPDQTNAASVRLTVEHWSGCLIGGKRCESSSGTSEYNLALAPNGPNAFDADMNAVHQIPVNADVLLFVSDGGFALGSVAHGDVYVNGVKIPFIAGAWHFYETADGIVIPAQGQ
jgi:hypothetical protein